MDTTVESLIEDLWGIAFTMPLAGASETTPRLGTYLDYRPNRHRQDRRPTGRRRPSTPESVHLPDGMVRIEEVDSDEDISTGKATRFAIATSILLV